MAMTNRNNAKLGLHDLLTTLDELVPQDHLVCKDGGSS